MAAVVFPPPHPSSAPHQKHRLNALLVDCDNTLTLTEENAFAATTQTINTLLADFKIAPTYPPRNPLLTASALHELQDSLTIGGGGTGRNHSQQRRRNERQHTHSQTENYNHSHNHTSNSSSSSGDNADANFSDSNSNSNSSSEDEELQYQTYSTASLLADYIGLPFRRILTSISARHNITLTAETTAYYTRLEEHNVNTQISLHSPPAPDVLTTLQQLRNSGRFQKIVVVSSSPLARVKAALKKTHLYPDFFNDSELFSASDSLAKPLHKPHPAVYQHVLATLGFNADDCLAVEDSVSGCLAAVRAGIRCLGYVGGYHDPGKRRVMSRILQEKGAGRVMEGWGQFAEMVGVMEGLESPRVEWDGSGEGGEVIIAGAGAAMVANGEGVE